MSDDETFTVANQVLLDTLNAQLTIQRIRNVLSDFLKDEITKEKVPDMFLHSFIHDLLIQRGGQCVK